ncbi:hypothetical protein LZ198_37860 [Myxococcus sp. K15C18031901]|uniref:hypothetical protein n=1 Tax=Myxococcus dinghuensis TaxID=2906761 RepID=UPI0020A78964|nr:hypothetical protein [Myxococcus dinghuensis]MCP3104646.1 hypothetical protein [Myxococcus dinghuensis]
MFNLMKSLAGVLVLTLFVGCGPVDTTGEGGANAPPVTPDNNEVSAESLDGFFDCLGVLEEDLEGNLCVTNCIFGLPDISYVTSCLVTNCRFTLPQVTACLPELVEL